MTLLVEYADIQPGSAFMQRLEAAMFEQTDVIRKENANVVSHEARLVWARNVEQNAAEMLKKMKVAVGVRIAALGSPPAELNLATDAQIRSAVAAEINKFLGD